MPFSARSQPDRLGTPAPIRRPHSRRPSLRRGRSFPGTKLVFPPLVAGLVLLAALRTGSAEDWPCWRGPNHDGTSNEATAPVHWSDTENVAWKVAVPETGHASPIVSRGVVYLVGTDETKQNRMLLAFDRQTGRRLWERVVLHAPLERKHRLNSWASSTPATDGERIYVSFLDVDRMFVAAYDRQGNRLWAVHPGVFSSRHGYCSSPVLFEDLVIVNGDHDGDAYIVALDRSTGAIRWKIDRENKTRSYCTPLIRAIDGRPQMMLSGSKCIASYDPRTGERLWIFDGPTDQFVASLVYGNGLVFVTGGFPDKHILAIDPRGRGNITGSDYVKWRHYRNGVSYVPSPVAVGEWFFVVSDNGIGTCFEARSGRVLWQHRMGRRYSASLVACGGNVYFLDDDGITKVVRAAPTYELIAENPLNEATYASIAVSDGQLFIRGERHLFCIGRPAATASR
ncbi:MAG: serine/threonine protein kinase [Planctomycetota bacterium]|nr:MAG: serine/threonine protein kinase [Planctomycetota bacterium]